MPSFLDSPASRIMSRVPGLSDNLPAKVDVWGNDITGEGGAGPDILSPLWVSNERNDPVTAEMLRLNARFGRMEKTVDGVRLSPEQYNQYQRVAGQYIYADLADAMADPQWEEMDDEERLKWVDAIKSDARAAAREELSLGAGIPKGWEVVPPGWEVVSN